MWVTAFLCFFRMEVDEVCARCPAIGNIDAWNAIANKIVSHAAALKNQDKIVRDLLGKVQKEDSSKLMFQ